MKWHYPGTDGILIYHTATYFKVKQVKLHEEKSELFPPTDRRHHLPKNWKKKDNKKTKHLFLD